MTPMSSLTVNAGGYVEEAPLADGFNQHALTPFTPANPWIAEIDLGHANSNSSAYLVIGDPNGTDQVGAQFDSDGASPAAIQVYDNASGLFDFINFPNPAGSFTLRLAFNGTTLTASVGATSVSVTPTMPFSSSHVVAVGMVDASVTIPWRLTAVRVTQ